MLGPWGGGRGRGKFQAKPPKPKGLVGLTFVHESWKPLLQIILDNIHFHISPPVALAEGRQALSDKVSAETHKMHLESPHDASLREVADIYRANTCDMGTELGIPGFRLEGGKPESVLPTWVERSGMVGNLDDREAVSSSDGGGGADLSLGMDIDTGEDIAPPGEQVEPRIPGSAPAWVRHKHRIDQSLYLRTLSSKACAISACHLL